MTHIRFFACSVGEPGKDYVEENLQRIINDQAFVLHQDTTQKGVFYSIKPDDILLLKYNNSFIAYGKTTGGIKTDHEEWNLRAPVIEWFFKDPSNVKEGVSISGIGYETTGGGQYGTVKAITPAFGLQKIAQINNTSQTYLDLMKETQLQQQIVSIQDKIELLKYKKQIILQGPPGTGKTYQAKIIAKEMTKAQKLGSPMQKINDFFKSFDSGKPEVVASREENQKLLEQFHLSFPQEKIKDLNLETYCIGTGSNDTFCWWIERGLKPLGYYFPGSSRSYLIYWSKSNEEYSTHFKHSKYLSDSDCVEDAMSRLASLLSEMVLEKKFDHVDPVFGAGFILKIMHSYYPEEYFPINSVAYLNNALKILGINYSSMNYLQKNLALQDFFIQRQVEYGSDVTNFEFMKFLVDNFDLKGDINVEDSEVKVQGEFQIIQFHPSYTYEDFVRGITAKSNKDSQIEYKIEDKILALFAQQALDNPSGNYVLIIDEVNRANLPSVLGELIYALEYRFDENLEDETTVTSIYSTADPDGSDESYDEGKKLKLPKNLFIIGTMNTADRSVGHIDYAIRRRFAFVDTLPTPEPIKEFARPKFKQVSELFIKNYDSIDWSNPKPERSDSLAHDFRPEDVWIGHSYFITEKDGKEGEEELKLKIKYEVVPILKEYLKDGILLNGAEAVINKLDD